MAPWRTPRRPWSLPNSLRAGWRKPKKWSRALRRPRARSSMASFPSLSQLPDEARAERFPVRALLRRPMVWRLALFIAIWFVYYIGNYGWLTLAPTLFTDKGYSLT